MTTTQTENANAPALPDASQANAPASLQARLGPIPVGNRGIELRSIEDVFRFAKAVAMSQLCPPGFSETDCFLVIQNGLEVGMSPMAALANTYIVNRRATIFGDMPLALVRQSGLLENYTQLYSGKPFEDDYRAIVTTRRKGMPVPITTEYSVAEARIAELWGKKGPWTQAPSRMLLYRARGFNLRDNFGDVLKGCAIAELDDGENLPGFDNAKAARVVAPNFEQTPAPAPPAAPEPPEPEPPEPEPPAPAEPEPSEPQEGQDRITIMPKPRTGRPRKVERSLFEQSALTQQSKDSFP